MSDSYDLATGDTMPCPPMCEHRMLSADASMCLCCGDEMTVEVDAETLAAAMRET